MRALAASRTPTHRERVGTRSAAVTGRRKQCFSGDLYRFCVKRTALSRSAAELSARPAAPRGTRSFRWFCTGAHRRRTRCGLGPPTACARLHVCSQPQMLVACPTAAARTLCNEPASPAVQHQLLPLRTHLHAARHALLIHAAASPPQLTRVARERSTDIARCVNLARQWTAAAGDVHQRPCAHHPCSVAQVSRSALYALRAMAHRGHQQSSRGLPWCSGTGAAVHPVHPLGAGIRRQEAAGAGRHRHAAPTASKPKSMCW